MGQRLDEIRVAGKLGKGANEESDRGAAFKSPADTITANLRPCPSSRTSPNGRMHEASRNLRGHSPSAELAGIAARLASGSGVEDYAHEFLKSAPAEPELLMLIAGSRR